MAAAGHCLPPTAGRLSARRIAATRTAIPPLGDRRVAVVEGGSFEGPKRKGTVLKGGSDWLISRPDGALQLDVRLTLKTDDGRLIGMVYRGYRHRPAAVMDRLNRGEKVDPSEYYFRTAPFFETSSEKYGWLNRILDAIERLQVQQPAEDERIH